MKVIIKKSMNVLMEKSMSADGNWRPVQSAGGCFLKPILVAGNSWEMINELVWASSTTHWKVDWRKHSFILA